MPRMTCPPGVRDLLGEPNGFQSRERLGGLGLSFSTMSVEVLGKVVGAMTVRLVAMQDRGIKRNILLIEINKRMQGTVCRERLSSMMVILHGSMMDFPSWRKKHPLPRRGYRFRR